MESINIALRLFIVSQLFLFALMVVQSNNPMRIRVVVICFIAGTLSYLLMPIMAELVPAFRGHHILWFPSNITPSLLLLMVWFIFEEKCVLPKWLIAIISFGILSSLWFHLQELGLPDAPLWLQASKLLIALGSILVVWLGRDNDLVETRFKIRNLFIASLGLMMFVIMVIDIFSGYSTPIILESVELVIIFAYALFGNYFMIKLNPKFELMSEHPRINENSEDQVIVELLEKMRSDRLYADHDLRVASLASLMKIPEYKLRNKINQQLGYRNFNQFVNRYRIEEASVKLLEDVRLPVLSIALDVGFRSISSFNTAFQAQFGVSPTKYRHEATQSRPPET